MINHSDVLPLRYRQGYTIVKIDGRFTVSRNDKSGFVIQGVPTLRQAVGAVVLDARMVELKTFNGSKEAREQRMQQSGGAAVEYEQVGF
mgnify:CR=1 FL=1